MESMGECKVHRYIKGTKNYAIKYLTEPDQNLQQNTNLFYGYANAAYANTDDYKSTSGYVYVVGGGAITWRSKKQTTIALLSTEVKYIALSEAGRARGTEEKKIKDTMIFFFIKDLEDPPPPAPAKLGNSGSIRTRSGNPGAVLAGMCHPIQRLTGRDCHG